MYARMLKVNAHSAINKGKVRRQHVVVRGDATSPRRSL